MKRTSPNEPDSVGFFPMAPRTSERGGVTDIPVVDLASDVPLPPFEERSTAAPSQDLIGGGMGHPSLEKPQVESPVLMCSCPDCHAPMTINLVLFAADCWRCQTSIELTEQQKREIQRELARRAAAKPASPQQRASAPRTPALAPTPAAKPTPPSSAPKSSAPEPKPAAATTAPRTTAQPAARPQPAAATAAATARRPAPPPLPPASARPQREAAAQTRRQRQPTNAHPRRKSLFDLPSWLISAIFHMILLTLMALITFPGEKDVRFITISSEVSKEVREGGNIHAPADEDLNLDLPLPEDTDLDDPRDRKAIVRADQDARELRIDDNAPNLPNINVVRAAVSRHGDANASLIARDPRLRVEMVKKEGGTTLTEAAVSRGLRWIARHQASDGRWSLHDFHSVEGCTCRNSRGVTHSDTAGTGLALLPFLGAGQTHLVGRYRDHVTRGLHWLLRQQDDNGDLRGQWRGQPGMYAHGICSIVLCEAFLLTGDEQLRGPAQRAINFIVDAQNAQGGWRYTPGERNGDTSVLGWQLMALQSGRAAGLEVPESVFNLSGQFLDLVEHRPNYTQWLRGWKRRLKDGPPTLMEILNKDRWSIDDVGLVAVYLKEAKDNSPQLQGMWKDYQKLSKSGGRYAYQYKQPPTHVMTAEGLLCRMYLGWNRNMPGMVDGAEYLLDHHLPSRETPNIYYWYYGTQVFHHLGGPMWDRWNRRMRDVLVLTQEKSGHEAGSWNTNRMRHASGGRLYVTALAVCTLEVYYRHLPIYRQIDLNAE